MPPPKPVKKPAGSIRLSQVVTTFGPGAMVDLIDAAVLVAGTDTWRYPGKERVHVIAEPRLRDEIASHYGMHLAPDKAFLAPPAGEEKASSESCGIPVLEFPAWRRCLECRALEHAKNLDPGAIHRCSGTRKSATVPVRFVVTCENGHLSEFPWIRFAHAGERSTGRERCGAGAASLFLDEGKGTDFSEITVRCESCGAERKLSNALAPGVLGDCHGDRPWLVGAGSSEDCQKKLTLLIRTASNSYFSKTLSAISIPDPSRRLVEAVQHPAVWAIVKDLDPAAFKLVRNQIEVLRARLGAYADDSVLGVIQALKTGQTTAREELRTAEYQVLMGSPDERPGRLAPGVAGDSEEYFFANRLVPTEPLPRGIRTVVLVKRLRQVQAQLGFTRLQPLPTNLQGGFDASGSRLQRLGTTTTWLPATEIFGEGFFIELDPKYLASWERRQAVVDRGEELRAGHARAFIDREGPPFPGERFYLLHTLSHLLMNAVSLTCGYAASSLSERIYCAPATDPTPMGGILLLTGTSGAEGTLGGLVAQGRHLRRHLRRAWEMGTLCSNDPVCAMHDPEAEENRYLEGAACHGCVLVAECSCERFNQCLDRALVAPALGHPEDLAYFTEAP